MSAHDLVRKCNDALRVGVDFPTLWHTIIRSDPMVLGPPVLRLEDDHAYLEVALLSGGWLVVDNEKRAARLR